MNNMKGMNLHFCGLLLTLLLGVGCTSVNSEETVRDLVFEENPALRHVVALYEGDSLKQQAALFLIDNLAYHEGVVEGDMRFKYKAYELFGTGKFTYQQALDSAARVCGTSGSQDVTLKKDIYIDPIYLISNIEGRSRFGVNSHGGRMFLSSSFANMSCLIAWGMKNSFRGAKRFTTSLCPS